MKLLLLLSVLFISPLFSQQSFWDKLPEPIGFVNDFENILTQKEEKELNNLITDYEKKTTVEIAIVTIPTSATSEEKFNDLSLYIAKSWGVGKKVKNNGILIAISDGYSKIRIQNGLGIEQVISDEETKKLIDEKMIPYFKKGDYYSGLKQGLQTFFKILSKINENLARLSIYGGFSEISISDNEEIWFATKAGNVYYSKSFGDLWHLSYGSHDQFQSISGNNFERVNFFSNDTIMISGFIQNDGKTDYVLLSENHGKSWEKVKFGKESWIDACFVNEKGKGWMSGSSQMIYYTENFGKSWTQFEKIEKTGNLRFSSIHFSSDEKTGLFGSFWNVIYKTTDNCQTWEKIQTPLDQKKYKNISSNERPDIRKIRIFGNFYIVNQQGKIFISQKDSVNWRYLSEASDFEVSKDDELYIVNKDLTIEFYDSEFKVKWKTAKSLLYPPSAIKVKHSNLFVLTRDQIYKINENEFLVSQLFTDDYDIREPFLKVEFENEIYGFEDGDVLKLNKENDKWFRKLELGFGISNVTVYDNKIVLSCYNNLHYIYDNELNEIQPVSFNQNLVSNKEIDEIKIEIGSRGCFHNNEKIKVFKSNKHDLILDKNNSDEDFLPLIKEIKNQKAYDLLYCIDSSRYSKLTLKDLNISEEDIYRYKNFLKTLENKSEGKSYINIDDFKEYNFYANNKEYDFYLQKLDSFSQIDDDLINNAFSESYGYWSTTTNWRSLSFLFKDGTKMEIINSDYSPNYLYSPWTINYEGLIFTTNSVKIGQLIDQITVSGFFMDYVNDKTFAIHSILNYLYKKSLE